VLFVAAQVQQAAVDQGMEGLDPPSSISGKPVCSLMSLTWRPASRRTLACRGADELDAEGCEALGEFGQAGFVGDGIGGRGGL